MDKEYLLYIINVIKKTKGTPFCMTDIQSANVFLPYLKIEFPSIQMLTCNENVWFVVSPRAKIALRHNLQTMIKSREQEIKNLQRVIDKLNER